MEKSEKSKSKRFARLHKFSLGWTLYGHLFFPLVTGSERGAGISPLLALFTIDSPILPQD
jgi:hypothetical protein